MDWEHRFEPGIPVFAQVTRDGLSLFLTGHAGDCRVQGAAYLVVDDVHSCPVEAAQVRGRPARACVAARITDISEARGGAGLVEDPT